MPLLLEILFDFMLILNFCYFLFCFLRKIIQTVVVVAGKGQHPKVLRKSQLLNSGHPIGCWGPNPSCLLAMQAPSPLYYLSSPPKLNIKHTMHPQPYPTLSLLRERGISGLILPSCFLPLLAMVDPTILGSALEKRHRFDSGSVRTLRTAEVQS